jgi:hypothetical protein
MNRFRAQRGYIKNDASRALPHLPGRGFASGNMNIFEKIARGKGIPFTQLMAMWLHERISREKSNAI